MRQARRETKEEVLRHQNYLFKVPFWIRYCTSALHTALSAVGHRDITVYFHTSDETVLRTDADFRHRPNFDTSDRTPKSPFSYDSAICNRIAVLARIATRGARSIGLRKRGVAGPRVSGGC